MFYLRKKIIRHKMKRIQAKKHKIGTYEIDKISLSCFDDKRYVLDDRSNTDFIKIFTKIVIIIKNVCDNK